jgi:hypothetical protein
MSSGDAGCGIAAVTSFLTRRIASSDRHGSESIIPAISSNGPMVSNSASIGGRSSGPARKVGGRQKAFAAIDLRRRRAAA